jgi:DNA repair protein RadC
MAERRQKSPGLKEAVSSEPHFHGHRGRLRERLLAAGAENLPDYELMEVLLFAGNPRGDTKPLAKDLIERFGGFAEALSADPDELLGVPGLGVAGAAALKSVREAALRLMKAELRDRPVIGSWDRLIDYCRAHIAYGKVEEFPVFGRKWDQNLKAARRALVRRLVFPDCAHSLHPVNHQSA